MRQARVTPAIAFASLLALALAGCSADSSDESSADGDCEVRSLLVGSLTGASGEHGIGTRNGSESAVRTINEAGGINGCTLVLDVIDDGGDTTQTLALTQAALQEHDYAHVDITGYGGSSVQPYLISEGQFSITTLGIANVYDPETAPYQFDTISLLTDSNSIVVQQAIDDGADSIAVIVDNTSTGQSTTDAVTATIEDGGAEVATVEAVDQTAVDYSAVVQRVLASGADTVFFDVYGAAVGYLIRDILAAGWDGPIYAGQIAYVTDLAPLLDADEYEGIIMGGSAGVTAPSSDAAQAVIDDVVANGDENIAAHLAGVLWGSDSLTLFAWAANSVGSTDPAEMSTFLEENGEEDVPGLTMATNTGYSSTNHDWKGADSIALVSATPKDDAGRFPERVGLYTPAS